MGPREVSSMWIGFSCHSSDKRRRSIDGDDWPDLEGRRGLGVGRQGK